MKLVMAADHGGFQLKEDIKQYLEGREDLEIIDIGSYGEESVDYPLYGYKSGRMVADGEADRGIVICGTGIGISIAANKVKGIRAALATNTFMAEMSRKHNDANILALGGRVLSFEEAKPIVDIWLSTEFEGGRHKRRVDLIQALEIENIEKENGMGNVYVFDHPLIQHKLAILRDKNTSTKDFRELVKEISMLMTFEATRGLPLKEVEIDTPMCKATMHMLEGEDIAIVPILRAGLGMVEGMQALIPNAKVGHIGIYRDPDSHMPIEYYCKIPSDISERQIFVVDPMLATGGSAAASIDFIKERGGKNIIFMCLIAAPEGIKVLHDAHPDVDIFIAAKDSHLNEKAYIIPGLGDAGDRLFGTK